LPLGKLSAGERSLSEGVRALQGFPEGIRSSTEGIGSFPNGAGTQYSVQFRVIVTYWFLTLSNPSPAPKPPPKKFDSYRIEKGIKVVLSQECEARLVSQPPL
jgi:hypothetical protein